MKELQDFINLTLKCYKKHIGSLYKLGYYVYQLTIEEFYKMEEFTCKTAYILSLGLPSLYR